MRLFQWSTFRSLTETRREQKREDLDHKRVIPYPLDKRYPDLLDMSSRACTAVGSAKQVSIATYPAVVVYSMDFCAWHCWNAHLQLSVNSRMCVLPYSVANHIALRTSTLVVVGRRIKIVDDDLFHVCTRDQDKCTRRVEILHFPCYRGVDALVAYALSIP
jgi:hypothetical protein